MQNENNINIRELMEIRANGTERLQPYDAPSAQPATPTDDESSTNVVEKDYNFGLFFFQNNLGFFLTFFRSLFYLRYVHAWCVCLITINLIGPSCVWHCTN